MWSNLRVPIAIATTLPLPIALLLAAERQTPVSFEKEIKPIFEAKCLPCHNSIQALGGLDMDSIAGIRAGGDNGSMIIAGDPAVSLLVQRINPRSRLPLMPAPGEPLPANEIALIRRWIEEGASTPDPTVSFPQDVLRLLKTSCTSCHSGDDPAGELDLSTARGVRFGGTSGPLFDPSAPENSLIIRRLRGLDGLPQMPFGFKPLESEQIEMLEEWIREGGPTVGIDPTTHWAFTPPVRPPIPEVSDKGWIRNPIDAFVLSRLDEEKLKPSPEATKETLIRRLSLDLVGLPPSIEEIDAFLADDSPNAYADAVERLLRSPHYGERQAQFWLDLARYADTNGFEADRSRVAWLYRDWVINAFNDNMPYNQFTIEQIAGDLLPNATIEQRVATGFHRNSMWNGEGGVDADEGQFTVVLDRINTTGTVWLGATIECARCHDHKFDPYTTEDYYRMFAFFNNSDTERRGDRNVGAEKLYEPLMPTPTWEQEKKRLFLEGDLYALQLDDGPISTEDIVLKHAQMVAATRNLLGGTWTAITDETVTSSGGATPEKQPDGTWLLTGENPAKDTITVTGTANLDEIGGLKIEALKIGDKGPGRVDHGNFVLTGITLRINGEKIQFAQAFADYTQVDFDPDRVIAHDVSSGWAVAQQYGKDHVVIFDLPETLRVEPDAKVEVTMEFNSRHVQHTIGHFRVLLSPWAQPTFELVSADALKEIYREGTSEERKKELMGVLASRSLLTLNNRRAIKAKSAELAMLKSQIPSAMVMRDRPTDGPVTANIHTRGEFLSPDREVTADTPAFLPPMADGLPKNRLGLAKWLVDDENPLSARVQVNRIWRQYFGRALVETVEDLGTQGEQPTHPELLDWLAVEFVESGWDMKHIHRLIVNSATYRQVSTTNAELIDKDPENQLFARGPRFRMDAEMIRDNALVVSGLFSPKIGGPSVFPYQPDGIWDSPYNADRWKSADDSDRYRRGLYTFWKRTSPYPSFTAFDATSREVCTVRRIRTNTPLQALALLNDEAMMEAARALAKRIVSEADSVEKRITRGFRLCTARPPTRQEHQRLLQLLEQLQARFSDAEAIPASLADDPEMAAWTMFANSLLNLDETITKE